MDIEKAEKTLLGKKVLFPEGSNPDDIGIITDVYFQPSIDLNAKNPGLVFLSDDELPDRDGNYPKPTTSPKILCRVQFDGYVYITEPQDLKVIEPTDEI